MLEGLEARRLLAASLASGGLLNIIGTSGNDNINVARVGTNHVVTLNGVVSNFAATKVKSIFIDGKSGNDRLVADDSETTKVTIRGGTGNDYLRGGGADATLKGEDGDDIIHGGLKSDLIQGGPGVDTADYADRTDNLVISLDDNWNDGAAGEKDNVYHEIEIVLGGSGNDVLKGTRGNQTLMGNGGNDRFNGEGGQNMLVGGPGDDTMASEAGADDFSGGEGSDTADYTKAKTAVLVVLDDDANDGGVSEGDNVHNDVEEVIGSAFADRMVALGSADRTFRGGGGGDSMFGADGNDLIDGGDGDDLEVGGAGDNCLLGGLGGDTLFGGVGKDKIVGGPDSAPAPLSTQPTSTSSLTLICLAPDADFISGNDGDDTISGGMDNDTIIGSTGADQIDGGSGNDEITSEEDNDTINGGDGNDTIGAGDGDDVIDGGLGVDSIFGGDGDDKITDDGAPLPPPPPEVPEGSTESLTLTADPAESAPAVAYGGAGNDTMTATGPGQQILIGDDGDDHLTGGDGPDILDGAAGNDVIFGNGGNDTIAGGYGGDDLHGNAGNDVFVNNDGEADTIHGGDDIDLVQFEESFLDQPNTTFTEGEYDTPDQQPTIGAGDSIDALTDTAQAQARALADAAGLSSASLTVTLLGASQVGSQLQVFGETSNGSPIGDNISITQSGGTIFVAMNGRAAQSFTGITSVYVDSGGGNDNIALQLFSGGNPVLVPSTILAGNGNDTVVGGAATDFISGGNDADNLTGAGGNDSIQGDAGNDTMDGSAGDDYLNGGNAFLGEADGADVLGGGSGAGDYADYSGRTIPLTLNLDGIANDSGDLIGSSIENILGGKSNDMITGNGGANFLSGGQGQDTLKGGGGNDQLVASVTTDLGLFDFVFGNAGYDYLFIEDKIRDNYNAIAGQDFWRNDINPANGQSLDTLVPEQF